MYKKYLESQRAVLQQGSNDALKQEHGGDDHTDDIVEECWRIIEDQCKEYVTSVDVKQEERKAWQTVRVFVSSTFSDFFSEREILVKKVFPELREWCEGRKLQLVECDLRWGVPKDFTDEQTIRVCMEEIDRCFEQNQGKPFFIGMLGERYGWIPELDNIPEDMCTKYDWVPNTSITCMEMLHGAYRYCNPNAAFFIRNSKVLDEIPHDHVRRFQDSASLSQKQLEELKKRLRLKFPKQVFDYSCNFDGIKEQSGRKRVHLSDFENFSEHIISFLKSAIQRTYPLVIDLPVQSEDEIDLHRLIEKSSCSAVKAGNDHCCLCEERRMHNRHTKELPESARIRQNRGSEDH